MQITINNVEICSTYGITEASTDFAYAKPSRIVDTYEVRGRNGSVKVDSGAYSDVDITLKCVIRDDFDENYADLMSFLYSLPSDVRIECSVDTDHFRTGTLINGITPKSLVRDGGSFDIVFSCKPQRWLKSGETKIVIDNSNGTDTMRVRPVNPTNYKAYPILYTNGNANIIDTSSTAVYCVKFRNANAQRNGFISAYGLATNRCKWDCESRNVYMLDGDTGNDVVNYGVYAFNGYELNSNGETVIDVYAGWKVEIEPRWWEI